ncbi:MAG TPA: YetF domain-containing protein [Salinarimonas sp.]|jgi:uncharacterized membrane protein YcaP (DUF421 family)|nr:YetF domain-containing protein [Salinarimonas sp.]
MSALTDIDWQALVIPTHSVAEMMLRGTVMYLALFVLMRVILKRQSGGLAITDVLVVVLIADAAQNGMARDYESVTEGVVLVATILFWSYALDWLGYRFPAFERLMHPPPLRLVEDGRLLRRNMRQELITIEDLMSAIREQGVAELADVKLASIEADGRISVIPKDGP